MSNSLTSIVLSTNLTTIWWQAFYYNKLTSVIILQIFDFEHLPIIHY